LCASRFEGQAATDFRKFVAERAFWAEFLDFEDLRADLSDESDLCFREVQLDLSREALDKV
jgi:hypothetical protein